MRKLCVVALVLAGGLPSIARADDAAKQTPFVSTLMSNWKTFDRDGDGKLSIKEIDHAVLDPKVTGDAAAAAGTLKLLAKRKSMDGVEFTQAYFEKYNEKRLNKGETPTTAAAEDKTVGSVGLDGTPDTNAAAGTNVDWDVYYTAGKQRIARGVSGWSGHFDLDHMRQGPLGDCYFISSVGSLVVHRPEQITKLVTPLPDGTFRASFPGADPFIVKRPTDSELAASSVSPGDGLWLAVMEQAFGQYRAHRKGKTGDVDGTDIIRTGGDSGTTMEMLTGNAHTRIRFPKSVEKRAEQADTILPKLRDAIVANIDGRRAITAGIVPLKTDADGKITTGEDHGTAPKIPAGFQVNHVYAVISYDRASDTVEIWNPHGQEFTPKDAAGVINGYPTSHGRFKLPLKDAYSFYTSFTFEGTTPATAASPTAAVN